MLIAVPELSEPATWPQGPTVRELRKTREGRLLLQSQGKDKWNTERKLRSRQRFVMWDGEGGLTPDDRHELFLWGNSDGVYVHKPILGTRDCFDLLIDSELSDPNVIHIIYAGTYDAEMMFRDIPVESLRQLRMNGNVHWQEFRVEFRKGKWIRLSCIRDGKKVSLTVYDIFTFFGTSFVKAVSEYLGSSPLLTKIEEGKKQRGIFTYQDFEYVLEYWQSELIIGVQLADKLREYLEVANIHLTSWHGPGAVASQVLKGWKIEQVMRRDQPDEFLGALQHAYAGGHFEQFKLGEHKGTVYQYDLNSAYPSAIAQLPNLATGTWEQISGEPEVLQDFALYHCAISTWGDQRAWYRNQPRPMFWRSERGAVYYPENSENYIWGVEAKLLREYFPDNYWIYGGWEFYNDGTQPFAFVADMYATRKQWKADGNPAQLALKLAMNSIYGKQAQRIGAKNNKPPQWHQLEYAGYVTACTRAALYRAMMQAGKHIISVETDAVFTTHKLDLPISGKLGEWSETKYEGFLVLQNGIYWALEDGVWKHKFRGFDKDSLTLDKARAYLSGALLPNAKKLSVNVTRFQTMGVALGKETHRQWTTTEREINAVARGGKRFHFPRHCYACKSGYRLDERLHNLIPEPNAGKFFSARHSLPWRDSDYENEYPFNDEGLIWDD